MIPRKLVVLYVATLFLSSSILAGASSAHTWVAAWGSDSNTGTYASPYADFQTAVTNTTAGGIVSVEGPGDYGAVSIYQSVTIDGGGSSITFTGSEGINIATSASATVILRNLTIDGVGQGSYAIYSDPSASLNLVINGCHLEGFTFMGVAVYSNVPVNVAIRDTVIQGGQIGVRTFQSSGGKPNDHLSLQNVTVQGASSAGIFTRNGSLNILDSVITENNIGLEADTSATLNISNSMVFGNTTGICVYATAGIRIANNDIEMNGTGIEACGGGVYTAKNNRVAGNTTNGTTTTTINIE